MYRIAIVEDDDNVRNTFKSYVERYSQESGIPFSVRTFSDGIFITENYSSEYDVIFLDVIMNNLDGMRTAEFIRKLDKKVVIIFITNMAQYAIKGYSVNAFDFLLKPVSYFAFSQQLKRCVESISDRNEVDILIPFDGGVKRVSSDDIYYVEIYRHDMTAHCKDGNYRFYGTMKEYEKKLSSANFIRCNNCYLVNLAYVNEVKDNTVRVNSDELSISRPRKKLFMEALVSFVGRNVR